MPCTQILIFFESGTPHMGQVHPTSRPSHMSFPSDRRGGGGGSAAHQDPEVVCHQGANRKSPQSVWATVTERHRNLLLTVPEAGSPRPRSRQLPRARSPLPRWCLRHRVLSWQEGQRSLRAPLMRAVIPCNPPPEAPLLIASPWGLCFQY